MDVESTSSEQRHVGCEAVPVGFGWGAIGAAVTFPILQYLFGPFLFDCFSLSGVLFGAITVTIVKVVALERGRDKLSDALAAMAGILCGATSYLLVWLWLN